MGLYDDDVAEARRSTPYAEARRRCEAPGLAGAAPAAEALARLGSALEGIDDLLAAWPALRCDDEVAGWRAAALAAGRALRAAREGDEGLASGWSELARRHADFTERLDHPDGFEAYTFERDRAGFTLWYPGTWALDASYDEGVVTVQPVDGSRDLLRVMTRPLRGAAPLEAVARAGVERLRQELPGANLSERGFRTLDAVDAFEVSFAFTNEQGTIRGFQIYAVRGNVALTVTFQALAEGHDRLEPLARAVERSLRWVGRGPAA